MQYIIIIDSPEIDEESTKRCIATRFVSPDHEEASAIVAQLLQGNPLCNPEIIASPFQLPDNLHA